MPVFLLALIARGSAAPLPDPVRKAQSAQRHYLVGKAMLSQARFKDAERELSVAALLAPERADVSEALQDAKDPRRLQAKGAELSPEALRAKAPLLEAKKAYRASDLGRAADAWNRALLLDQGNAEATEGLARMAAEKYRGDPDQPFDSSVHEFYDAALREARKDRFVEAQKKLENALALNPTQEQCKALLARIRSGAFVQRDDAAMAQGLQDAQDAMSARDWIKARLALEKASKTRPEDPGLLKAWGEWKALILHDIQEAKDLAAKAPDETLRVKKYKEVLAIDPQDAEAREELEDAELRQRSSRSEARSQKRADSFYAKGMDAWQAGRLADAADFFKRSLAIRPGDPETQKALEGLRAKLAGQAEKDAASSAALMVTARDLEAKGNLKEASDAYERAAAKDGGNAEARESAARLRTLINGK